MQNADGIYPSLPDFLLRSLSAGAVFHHFSPRSARHVPAHQVAHGTFSSLPRAELPHAGILQDLPPLLLVVPQLLLLS